jgi:hypothetical protein
LCTTELGEQTTVVELARLVTVTSSVSELIRWAASPL